jgi:hypothetical protein
VRVVPGGGLGIVLLIALTRRRYRRQTPAHSTIEGAFRPPTARHGTCTQLSRTYAHERFADTLAERLTGTTIRPARLPAIPLRDPSQIRCCPVPVTPYFRESDWVIDCVAYLALIGAATMTVSMMTSLFIGLR